MCIISIVILFTCLLLHCVILKPYIGNRVKFDVYLYIYCYCYCYYYCYDYPCYYYYYYVGGVLSSHPRT